MEVTTEQREGKQTYTCLHCGLECETIFSLTLHIFTDHLHSNIVLKAEQSKALLIGSMKLVFDPVLAGMRN